MKFKPVSLNASMLYLGDSISEENLDCVQHAFHMMHSIDGVIDITPSYTSLLIEYDPSMH